MSVVVYELVGNVKNYVKYPYSNFDLEFDDKGQADQWLRDSGYREHGIADDYHIEDLDIENKASLEANLDRDMYRLVMSDE